jgi:hypothetical protein
LEDPEREFILLALGKAQNGVGCAQYETDTVMIAMVRYYQKVYQIVAFPE